MRLPGWMIDMGRDLFSPEAVLDFLPSPTGSWKRRLLHYGATLALVVALVLGLYFLTR